MQIIGHRGARGTELENSPSSIRSALTYAIDGIEFDVHCTKDGELVVMHDATTKRTAEHDLRIRDVTLAELQSTRLRNAEPIPLLREVLPLVGDKHVYIDIKDNGVVSRLAEQVKAYPAIRLTVVSRLASELVTARKLLPGVKTYLYFLKAEHLWPRPIHMVRVAKGLGITGLALDKVYLNPVTYHLARKAGLRMYAYSIGSLPLARLCRRLYPELDIMTSHPERINHHSLA